MTLGGALVRNDLAARLAGAGAECELDGLFLGAGEPPRRQPHPRRPRGRPTARAASSTRASSATARGASSAAASSCAPTPRRPTRSSRTPTCCSRTGAEIDTKPQLEIWADDVRCSHGASIGRLDEDALFYLRSRGIGESAARDLLTRGFAAEVMRPDRQRAAGRGRSATLLLERLRGEAR